jgi:hypothetical protein
MNNSGIGWDGQDDAETMNANTLCTFARRFVVALPFQFLPIAFDCNSCRDKLHGDINPDCGNSAVGRKIEVNIIMSIGKARPKMSVPLV